VTFSPGRLLDRADRAGGGLAVDLGLYAISAVFALVTALSSTLLPHRAWGSIALWPYLAASLLVAAQILLLRRSSPRDPGVAGDDQSRMNPDRWRLWVTWVVWAGVAGVPLVVQAVQRAGGRSDRAQEEVLVVEHMGERLIDTGTPYLPADAIAALPPGEQLMGYSPYQPGMAIFGVPRALAGEAWWTDSRVWFAVATIAALLGAMRVLRGAGSPSFVRAVQSTSVLPICALTLATGGDDLPVLVLSLLALAFCAVDRFTAAGLAVGAAAALKLFAFPIVIVLAVLALMTGNGRRFLPGALGLPILVLVPPLLVDADAFVANVIRFPLGHGLVTSPAQSPFPGYLISSAMPGGRYVAAALLVAAGAAIAVVLLRRPPRTATTAALFCGYGLLAAILLMPTTRFGYLLYPIAFLVWAPALSRHTGTTAPRDDAALYRQ
jgi:hypothetical protein